MRVQNFCATEGLSQRLTLPPEGLIYWCVDGKAKGKTTMKIHAKVVGGTTSFAFSSTTQLDREFVVNIPENVAYYATCSLYDEQAGEGITYTVEIDIEDRAIVDPNQQINYFSFSTGNMGPQRTALIQRINAVRSIKIRVAEWPDRNRYESYVNRTDQVAPPDDSYINFQFVQYHTQNPAITRVAVLNIYPVY
jgi:hypothetical protein